MAILDTLSEHLSEIDNPEWYLHLLGVAIEEAGDDDVDRAIAIADAAYEETPGPPKTKQDEAWQTMLDDQAMDAFLEGGGKTEVKESREGGSATSAESFPGSRCEALDVPDVRAVLLERSEGEIWKGPGGGWRTIKNGRNVPAKSPGGDEAGSGNQGGGDAGKKANAAIRKELSDPQHPVTRKAGKQQSIKPKGSDLPKIATLTGDDLTASDHAKMASYHGKVAAKAKAIGKDSLAKSHEMAAVYHGQEGKKKSSPSPAKPAFGDDVIRSKGSYDYEKEHPDLNHGADNLSKAHRRAMEIYTDSGEELAAGQAPHEVINRALRAGKEVPAKHRETAARIKDAFKNTPEFEKPVPVWRGVSANTAKKLLASIEKSRKNGGLIEMGGFTSTSMNPIEALGFSDSHGLILEIKAKKGLSIDKISVIPGEQEMLLDSGAKYRVVAIKDIPYQKFSKGKPVYRKTVQLEQVA